MRKRPRKFKHSGNAKRIIVRPRPDRPSLGIRGADAKRVPVRGKQDGFVRMCRARKFGEDVATLHTFGLHWHVNAEACVTELDWPEPWVARLALEHLKVESRLSEKIDRGF